MKNLSLISKVKELYEQGENIIDFLKTSNNGHSDVESIMISYDLQAGSYTRIAKQNYEYINRYTDAIKDIFPVFGDFSSIMEVGIGEATLMNPLMNKIDPHNKLQKFGFDISWSRTRYARKNTEETNNTINLFMGDLFEMPLPDNSIDIIYTSHSLEPNGGREKEALRELYRVANKFVILLEPDFQNATLEGKERMTHHGYVRNLSMHAKELGFEVITDRPFGVCINPLNPTGLTIIQKREIKTGVSPSFVCPLTKAPLSQSAGVYFSSQSGLIYPIIDGIPCLLSSAAIVGLHFPHFCDTE